MFAAFAHPDGAFDAHHKVDKFWEEAEAKAALEGTNEPGHGDRVKARKQTRKPPTPFNTTAFTSAASSRLGITPARAMRIAEDLYMDGFISYPRTDNTVYPQSLPVRELLSELVAIDDFKAAAPLLEREPLEPTRGKKETTDHPPIYPTAGGRPEAARGALGGPPQGLRAGRAPLPRHLLRRRVRVHPRRHRGRAPRTTSCAAPCWSSPASSAIYPYGRSADKRSRSSRRARSSSSTATRS